MPVATSKSVKGTVDVLKAMDSAVVSVINAVRTNGDLPPSEDRLGSARSLAQMQRLLLKLAEEYKGWKLDGAHSHKGYSAFHLALSAFEQHQA